MKSTHWVVLLCSAAGLVFVATLAANFIGGRGGKKSAATPTVSQARLTFADAVTDFPTKPPAAELEVGQLHFHDFWFKNENAQTLPMGLFFKTCQCTNVLVWIAPADWQEVPKEEERAKAVKEVEAAAQPTDLKDKDAMITAPAGGVGVVRLTWKGERLGSKSLAATLWMGEIGVGPTQTFNIRVKFIPPLQAVPEIAAGDEISPDQLPLTIRIPCWSSSRSQFSLETKVVQGRLKDKSNPIVVGKPTPMTENELAGLRKDPTHGAVLAGYWAPVIVNKLSEDGTTAFDYGPFRQRVELTIDGADPIQVVVSGTIQGDVAPVDASALPVRFGPFDRTKEERRLLVLESEPGVTGLEMDPIRTAPFLTVEFPKEPEMVGGRKNWKLQIKWVPDSMATGEFPRGDEAMYHDSAVYVRPVGAKSDGSKSPYLRIPVRGTADPPLAP